MRALFFLPLLAACGTEANHLGNPLLWPLALPGHAIDEAVYNVRRAEVAQFVRTHHGALIAEIASAGGSTLSAAFDLAQIPEATRDPVTSRLAQDLALYKDDPDALIVALMVSGP